LTHPTQSLFVVLEQAKSSRDHAFMLLESSRKILEDARYKLNSLHNFRQQYEERWQGQFRLAGGMEIVRCYQDFMARLTSAVDEQAKRVDHLQRDHEMRRTDLLECERKLSAVEKLIERRQQEMLVSTMRKEQRDTDEMATRLALNTNKLQAPPC
jgi:flagellar protein FliJ